MVSWIAAIVLFALPQEKSLLQQIVPQPTGQNGYEDYLKACDALGDRSIFGSYLTFSSKPAGAVVTPEEAAELSPFDRRLSGMTPFEVRKEATLKFAQSLALLHRGNEKKVWDPREKVGSLTAFPEYAEFKSLAKLADLAAYVAFAEGRTRQGTQYLLDTFQLGQNLEGGILISHLVGLAIEAIAFNGFERHLAGLSRGDAALIEKEIPGLLSGTPRIVDSLKHERNIVVQTLDDFLESPEAWNPASESAVKWPGPELLKTLKSLDPSQRRSLSGQAEALIDSRMQPLYAKFDGPESGWGEDPGSQEEDLDWPTRKEQIPKFWAVQMTPVFSQSGVASARLRTQMRLLGLHAAVIRYMWDNNKLPDQLQDAVAKGLIEDPLSGQQFIYERQGTWAFRIYSPGSKATGEIGLRYKGARGAGAGNGDPVPPR